MFLRVVVSAGLACGLAAADQPLEGLLNKPQDSLQACAHQALENAISTARQKKLAKENKLKGGINWADVFGSKPSSGIVASAHPNSATNGCAIPLTQVVIPPGARFELKRIPLDNPFDPLMARPSLLPCR